MSILADIIETELNRQQIENDTLKKDNHELIERLQHQERTMDLLRSRLRRGEDVMKLAAKLLQGKQGGEADTVRRFAHTCTEWDSISITLDNNDQ